MKLPQDPILSTKTFVISHAILLIVALLFFGGLYYVLYQDKFQPSILQYIPVTKEPVALFLEIDSPDDDILVYDDNILISGKTGPDQAVIITSDSSSTGFQSGKDGQFSKVFSLEEGTNTIKISSFDGEGNSKTVTKQVYYTKEKLQ